MAIEYYFNVATGQVEEGKRSQGKDVMGPYATREEAAQALETARERTQSWDEEDAETDMWGWATSKDVAGDQPEGDAVGKPRGGEDTAGGGSAS